jgi:hypothetical protein
MCAPATVELDACPSVVKALKLWEDPTAVMAAKAETSG